MALSADSRIVLIRIKIERAKKHLRDLESEIGGLGGETQNVPLPLENPDTGEIVSVWTDVPMYTFDVLSIAGDVVHNLRSALDHLAYHLAVAGTDRPPSRRVSFPVAKSKAAYESGKSGKVEGIRKEAVEAIDRLCPYKGGNELLWRVHDLDNIDKHRFIFTIGSDALYKSSWHPPSAEIFGFLLRPRGLKADGPIFTGLVGSEMKKDLNFSAIEPVYETQIGEVDALLPFLRQAIDYIESVVFSFEPHLRTIE